MGKKRKKRGYSILYADSLWSVSKDRVYALESEPEESLADQIQCPVADEVLIALRKSFSLTFPRNPFMDGLQSALGEIRRICVEAVKPLSQAMSDLQLPPVPAYIDDPAVSKVHIFLFVFARTDDIDVTVTVDGKKRKFLDVIGHEDGTPLLRVIRSIITDTFSEAHDEDQHMAILERIRDRIWAILPGFNVCLDAMNVEPIARREDSPEDNDDSCSGQHV